MRSWIAAGCLVYFAQLSPAFGDSMDAPGCPPIESPGGTPPVYWWKPAIAARCLSGTDVPVIVVHAARRTRIQLFALEPDAPPPAGESAGQPPLPVVARLASVRGSRDSVYPLAPESAARALYLRIDATGGDSRGVSLSTSTLREVLERGAGRARMINLAIGALLSMAVAALLIWCILADRLFLLYSTFVFLQAVYIGFLSGQAFDWPILSFMEPLASFAWNVPVSLSGAVACLFTREIADLQAFAPRAYRAFGWIAAAFIVVTAANMAKLIGFGVLVNALGNLVFLGASVFTLWVSCVSWRRGNRAAGWFLIAWTLLAGFTITAALRFLATRSEDSDSWLYYYALPLSMVAAAVLIALGVADRLSQQRAALSEAERRAQTDPLTGVLNRRSLIEHLDAACARAKARSLPISVLFIDLDHFKLINDSFGHQAGDACLRAIIAPIQAELRQSDVVGRYGGEEFVVILSSADAAAAEPVAQRILQRVANIKVPGFGEPLRLTCSIGLAASDLVGAWGEELIARADAAVYAAKRAGRNQLKTASA